MWIRDILNFLEERKCCFTYYGDAAIEIMGFSSMDHYKSGTVTWIKSPQLLDKEADNTKFRLVVTERNSGLKGQNVIEADHSKAVFFLILEHFFAEKRESIIHEDSVIETDKIGNNVSIGHKCFIGQNVIIEDGVKIGNNVHIECPCRIGMGSIINSGVVIGSDGFGYFMQDNGLYGKVPHFGGVTIGENVEIGSNTCIDRGTIDDTCIDDFVKIDNLCHIAHNVHIGRNSLVIALSMLGGSSEIKENGYIAPGSMIKNQVVLGEHVFVGMGTVVLKDIPDNKVVAGVPARVLRDNEEGK